jgi:hypothetical protein
MAHSGKVGTIEAGRALCERWARDFDMRTGTSRDRTAILGQLQVDARGPHGPRRAMACLDLPTVATVLVHYGDQGKKGALKIEAAHSLIGRKQAYRDYWRNLERAALLMAGYELASPLGSPFANAEVQPATGVSTA